MAHTAKLRQSLKHMQRSLKRAAQQARVKASGSKGGHTINVVRRVNKAVAVNVGKPGSTQAISSRQSVHIQQSGAETSASETTSSSMERRPR